MNATTHEFEAAGLSGELARQMRNYRGSALRTQSQTLAASGDCPRPGEVRLLRERAIADPRRRDALARHLLDCPRCLEPALASIAPAIPSIATHLDEAPGRAAPRHGAAPLTAWAAAAVLLLAATVLFEVVGERRAVAALSSLHVADARGLEPRSEAAFPDGADGAAPIERRVVVQLAQEGFVALVRFREATPIVEPILGAGRWTAVRGGEEVVLPLDRAIAAFPGETWVVLHSKEARPATDADLARLGRRALRGQVAAGFSSLRAEIR